MFDRVLSDLSRRSEEVRRPRRKGGGFWRKDLTNRHGWAKKKLKEKKAKVHRACLAKFENKKKYQLISVVFVLQAATPKKLDARPTLSQL